MRVGLAARVGSADVPRRRDEGHRGTAMTSMVGKGVSKSHLKRHASGRRNCQKTSRNMLAMAQALRYMSPTRGQAVLTAGSASECSAAW